ncbi:MAG: XrtA system polysaccharide deacetylase [Candidatus Thiodiazotropha sp.]
MNSISDEKSCETDGIVNAITVDVEDYYQVSAFSKQVNKSRWSEYESRVERNTQRILEIFNAHNVKGTFFVLGWTAERYPKLIREISENGHEVASHGYSHDLVYHQTPETFTEETKRSKATVEQITGKQILGYRAASYSITQKSIWAMDILVELGFKYDSSIFPIMHDRYGIPGAKTKPHHFITEKGNSIIEFPLSTVAIAKTRFPVSGGGYFRLLPYWLTRKGLKNINQRDELPFIFYMHPWEIDKDQPRIKSSLLSQFRHYNNLGKFESRLNNLLEEFKFASVEDVLTRSGLYLL